MIHLANMYVKLESINVQIMFLNLPCKIDSTFDFGPVLSYACFGHNIFLKIYHSFFWMFNVFLSDKNPNFSPIKVINRFVITLNYYVF